MERRLIDFFDETVPDINPLIAQGLATTDVKEAPTYVYKVIESVFRNRPQGLRFADFRRATELEEFMEYSKKRKLKGKNKTSKRVFDLARSTKYLMKVYFERDGVMLDPFYLPLPFATGAGEIVVRGTAYHVSPVLTDPVFSVGIDNIFTRLLRAKVTFKKEIHYFRVDDRRELAQVIWSKIHNAKPPAAVNRLVTCHTPILLYTLCKFGFAEAFRHFTGLVPVMGDRETITTRTHPPEQWVICQTGMATKPKSCKLKDYEFTRLRLAIPRDQFNLKVKNLVGTFFYIADHFPNLVSLDHLEDTGNWQYMLGLVLFSMHETVGKIRGSVRSHMASLDNYIDTIVEAKLLDMGHRCSDLYTFFGIVIDNFNAWMLDVSDKIASMYGKELNVLYWLLLDVTTNICNLYFKLTASEKVLSMPDIKKIMNTQLSSGLFYKLRSGHAELSVSSSSSSCKAFKVTASLVSQSATARSKGKKKPAQTSLNDPAKALHVSLAEVGGHFNIQKSEGTGRSRISPFATVDAKRMIVRDPDLKEMLDLAQRLISEK